MDVDVFVRGLGWCEWPAGGGLGGEVRIFQVTIEEFFCDLKIISLHSVSLSGVSWNERTNFDDLARKYGCFLIVAEVDESKKVSRNSFINRKF